MRAKNWPISSGVTRARFWMVSLDPAVRDCDVPCVVPSVSLVPSVRERAVLWDVPCDSPSVQPFDLPWLSLWPVEPPCQAWPRKPPGFQLKFHERPLELLMPHDRPVLTDLFVPSVSETPVDVERDVPRETFSDSDVLSLDDFTSRITSVSPISLETYSREKWSSRLKNTLRPELARKVPQLSL